VAELGRAVVAGLTNIPIDLNGPAAYRARIGPTVVARATARALEDAGRA
jgi:aerobic carbon-monoxide dehydrogenase medium subunit